MSDLQCPATFHVVGPAASPDRELLDGAPVAAVYAGSGRRPPWDDVDGQTRPLPAGPLSTALDDLSDLHRGCHVLVLPGEVEAPLRDETDVVRVRIDADGRTIDRPA